MVKLLVYDGVASPSPRDGGRQQIQVVLPFVVVCFATAGAVHLIGGGAAGAEEGGAEDVDPV